VSIATPGDETLRELENELVEAEHEHDETLRVFGELDARKTLLQGNGIIWQSGRRVVRADGSERDEGRQAIRATVEIGGRVRYVDEIDPVETRVLLEEIEAQLGAASRPLLDARRRLANARVALANARLEPATEGYRSAVADLDAKSRQAEAALGQAVAQLVEYGRARDTARRAARKLGRIATDGAGDSRQTIEQLRNITANGDVPLRLTEGGVASAEGPDFEMLGGDDPTADATWQAVAGGMLLCVVEPDRAEAQLRETQLGRAAGFNKRRRGN
jgi:hypothetical protein